MIILYEYNLYIFSFIKLVFENNLIIPRNLHSSDIYQWNKELFDLFLYFISFNYIKNQFIREINIINRLNYQIIGKTYDKIN